MARVAHFSKNDEPASRTSAHMVKRCSVSQIQNKPRHPHPVHTAQACPSPPALLNLVRRLRPDLRLRRRLKVNPDTDRECQCQARGCVGAQPCEWRRPATCKRAASPRAAHGRGREDTKGHQESTRAQTRKREGCESSGPPLACGPWARLRPGPNPAVRCLASPAPGRTSARASACAVGAQVEEEAVSADAGLNAEERLRRQEACSSASIAPRKVGWKPWQEGAAR